MAKEGSRERADPAAAARPPPARRRGAGSSARIRAVDGRRSAPCCGCATRSSIACCQRTADSATTASAGWYSLISPPRICRRRIRWGGAGKGITLGESSGARKPSPCPARVPVPDQVGEPAPGVGRVDGEFAGQLHGPGRGGDHRVDGGPRRAPVCFLGNALGCGCSEALRLIGFVLGVVPLSLVLLAGILRLVPHRGVV